MVIQHYRDKVEALLYNLGYYRLAVIVLIQNLLSKIVVQNRIVLGKLCKTLENRSRMLLGPHDVHLRTIMRLAFRPALSKAASTCIMGSNVLVIARLILVFSAPFLALMSSSSVNP